MRTCLRLVVSLGFLGAAATVDAGARAAERDVGQEQMRADARAYYDSEMTTGFLFLGFGAVTAGAGAVTLTQSGDFARGLGLSSLVLGGLTAIGGAGYAIAVKFRGDYFTGLAGSDPDAYKREEGDRLEGTSSRFPLYLGSEIAEALAGIGMTAYGLAAKNDLFKGIGVGTAIQGIGMFVIDVPGAGRAKRYEDEVRRFRGSARRERPQIGFSMGGAGSPWALTVGQRF
jgi:hypothetical protein